MGYAVPAAMGAKVGRPDATVWAIDGDGCFQMTNQELATCALNNIPIKVAIINNGTLGMVRQWQTLFYNQRYSNTDLGGAGREAARGGGRVEHIPDFVKLSEAYGLHRAALREGRGGRRDHRARDGDRRPPGRRRLHRPRGRDGLADGRRRDEQRRDPGRPRRGPEWDNEAGGDSLHE